MKKYEVTEVVEKLIGKVKPIGDSSVDEKRFESLLELKAVLEYAFTQFQIVSDYRDSKEYSVSKAGEEAFRFLITLRDNLCEDFGLPLD